MAVRSASFLSMEKVWTGHFAPSIIKAAHLSSRLTQPTLHWLNSFFLAAAYSSMVPWKSR